MQSKKVQKVQIVLLCLAVFALQIFTACNKMDGSAKTDSVEKQNGATLEDGKDSKKEQPQYAGESGTIDIPVYLPLPYSNAFMDETMLYDEYMFLHDAAVSYYSTQVDAREGSLLLLSLRLIDEWRAGNSKYYLCYMATIDYYNISEQIASGAVGDLLIGESIDFYGGRLIRFRLSKVEPEKAETNYWGYQLEEILELPESGISESDVKELCGGRKIAEILCAAEQGEISKRDVQGIRYVLPEQYAMDSNAMIKKYLDTFFPDSLHP